MTPLLYHVHCARYMHMHDTYTCIHSVYLTGRGAYAHPPFPVRYSRYAMHTPCTSISHREGGPQSSYKRVLRDTILPGTELLLPAPVVRPPLSFPRNAPLSRWILKGAVGANRATCAVILVQHRAIAPQRPSTRRPGLSSLMAGLRKTDEQPVLKGRLAAARGARRSHWYH